MADTPIQSASVSAADSDALKTLQERADGLRDSLGRLTGDVVNFKEHMKSIGASADHIKPLDSVINTVGTSLQTVSNASSGNSWFAGLKDVVGSASNMFGSFASVAKGAFGKVMDASVDMKTLVASGAVLAGAKIEQSLVNKLNDASGGMLTMQQQIMDFNKSILQTGVAFDRSFKPGEAFQKAQQSIPLVTSAFVDLQQNLNATEDDVKGLQHAFQYMAIQDSTKAIYDSTHAFAGLGMQVNVSSAAFAVAKAVGADVASVAGVMDVAYSQLGEKLNDVPNVLGQIGLAAEKSGLSFSMVSKSIVEAAMGMKMWGGTIGAVSPVFKAFSDSMVHGGVGKQGLTPELFQSFVKGIEQMHFSTRAFLGMQAPSMGGAGGALGAGLKMEAAMEDKTGKGMADITKSIIDTLGKFGGGQGIITRAEAIENPELQKSFMVQRQLLMQLVKVDEASANQMMGVLKDVDKNGINTGKGSQAAQDKLKDLMAAGKATQEATTGEVLKATINVRAATLKAGQDITNAITSMANKFGFDKLTTELGTIMKESIKAGRVDYAELLKQLEGFVTGKERKIEHSLGGVGSGPRQTTVVPSTEQPKISIGGEVGGLMQQAEGYNRAKVSAAGGWKDYIPDSVRGVLGMEPKVAPMSMATSRVLEQAPRHQETSQITNKTVVEEHVINLTVKPTVNNSDLTFALDKYMAHKVPDIVGGMHTKATSGGGSISQ